MSLGKSSIIDAIIGFIDAPYTVSEGDGSALLQIGLIEGSIQGEVIVVLSTNDSTAIGKLIIIALILNFYHY